jgi:hypothetical protein
VADHAQRGKRRAPSDIDSNSLDWPVLKRPRAAGGDIYVYLVTLDHHVATGEDAAQEARTTRHSRTADANAVVARHASRECQQLSGRFLRSSCLPEK